MIIARVQHVYVTERRRHAFERHRHRRGERLARRALGIEQRLQPDLILRLRLLIRRRGRIGARMRGDRRVDGVILL
jgi:hypothetical protein